MATLSRPHVAEFAGISMTQLEYLGKLGVVAPDVGDQRKRFSALEARLTVIAGYALYLGISPKALSGPVSWLREKASFPDADIPQSASEIALELSAEMYRAVLKADRPDHVSIQEIFTLQLAAKVYAMDYGDDPLAKTFEQEKEAFESAQKQPSGLIKSRVQQCVAKAEKLLLLPQKWDVHTFRRIESALDFELACKDKKSMFLHLVAREEDEWQALLHSSLERLDGQNGWVVIDIRQLFRSRGMVA